MSRMCFRTKFTLALVLIAISIILFYLTTFTLIKNSNQYAENINLVGKQRMLTAKIVYYVNHLSHHKMQKHKILLKDAITEFETVESILQSRGYFFEEKNKKEYIEYVKHFLNTLDKFDIIHENEITDTIFEKQYEILINNIDIYVHKVQKESEKATQDIINVQTILLILFLLLLAFEAFYLFLPAEKEIEAKTEELENINKNLEERIADEVSKNQKQAVQMIQQSRLAQMGEMISMIAHQWRQPLASISAISNTLSFDVLMENYNKVFFQERLKSINELSQHLSSTIDDFRNFFKNDKKEEKISIIDIVDSSLDIIGETLKYKNIDVVIDIEKNLSVFSHANELKQVLLNLFKNSEDALLDNNVNNAKIFIRGYEENSYVYITVQDNAGGVPKEIISKIFDPYFSTKKEKDGTGLGLYMSKTIIDEHCHGELSLQNREDGACFIIKLPLQNKDTEL